MDAAGDGISSAVYNCRNGSIERIHANDNVDSLGMTWAALPTVFGFKGARHAGKFMGLAEYADEYPESLRIKMKDIISVDGMKIYNDFRRSRICGSSYEDRVLKLKQMFGEYSAAEVSYALQRRTEEIVGRFAQAAVDNTGCPDVVVAGGIFANVKVNQVIYETDVVDGIWVHPNMGDGGLGAGAAFLASDKATPQQLDDVYLGPKYDTEAIDEAIEAYGLSNKYKHSVFDSTAQMAEEAAKILKQGGVVSYYRDRMEYGPRALGNRSILHRPDDPDAIDWLNKRLDRTEFMPFAPVTLYEHAEECYEGYEPENCPASEFMTITFNCTDKMAERSPGVVHKDKTARPQILRKEVNEPYYRILKEFEKQTGIPTLINTSFNVHGEPIVCDPIEAIESFVNTDNEALIMENRIIRKNHEYQN
jgi:carbamoyltransferase